MHRFHATQGLCPAVNACAELANDRQVESA